MPRARLFLVVSAVSACRPAPPGPVDTTAVTSPRTPDPSHGSPASTVDCGDPIEGVDSVLRAGGLVMLGELHGTQQIPAWVGDLACVAATRGWPVRVGLELPRSHHDALAAYLAGSGAATEREALLEAEHWQRLDQDGRSSEAMLALIERVRVLRSAGLDVALFAFDVDAPSSTSWNERDGTMAEHVLARAAAEPEAFTLTLTGNLHNRAVRGLPWDPEAVPMGVHVLQARPDAVSLDVRYEGGTAWVCQQTCGTAHVSGRPEGAGRRIELRPQPDEHGQHGTFSVGPIAASPPAVGERRQ